MADEAARKVPTNAAGGIAVSDADLKAAFHFLDSKGKGKITMADLKQKLAPFYPDMPVKEYAFLMGDSKSLSLHDLKELLADNEITGFDPVAEAFKVYDPEGTGFADTDIMRQVFTGLGYTDLSDEDLDILVEAADKDGDGLVSLEDFRSMVYAAGSTDPAKGTAAGQ